MRREPSTTAEKVVNAIQVALWLGAVSFLLWFMITEFRKVQKSSAIVSSIDTKPTIAFPGILLCPAAEQLKSANDDPNLTNIGIDPQGALVNLGPVYSATTDNAYSVCPTLQVYSKPPYSVTCLNFVQSPTKKEATELFCNSADDQGKYATASPSANFPVWAANKATSSVRIETSLVNASSPLHPMLALFYSSKSLKSFPQSFDDYVNAFTVTSSAIDIPLSSETRILITKEVRDKYPSNTDCSYDSYPASNSVFYQGTIDPSSNSTGASTISIAYDTMDEETLCHRPVLTPPDVIGIIGGAIAMVVAATLFLSWLVRYFSGTNRQQQSNDFSALSS